MSKLLLVLGLVGFGVIATFNTGKPLTSSERNADDFLTPPAPSRSPELINDSSELLCSRLSEIKKIPHRDPKDSDPIFDAILSKGNEAVPCLVDKLTDTTLMDDPREAPPYQDFRVGDTAFFILAKLTKRDGQLRELLPPQYEKRWKTEGVYAYFSYVENAANRKKIQIWWKNWMKNNLK